MNTVVRYTKIICSSDGGSAFEDSELHLNEQQVASGVPPIFVGGLSSGGEGDVPSERGVRQRAASRA
jgi:hypothetical protein